MNFIARRLSVTWTKIKFIANQGTLLSDKIYINFERPIRRDDILPHENYEYPVFIKCSSRLIKYIHIYIYIAVKTLLAIFNYHVHRGIIIRQLNVLWNSSTSI